MPPSETLNYLVCVPFIALTAGPNDRWRLWLMTGDFICAATALSKAWHMGPAVLGRELTEVTVGVVLVVLAGY